MKKALAFILAMLMAATTVLASCAGSEDEAVQTTEAAQTSADTEAVDSLDQRLTVSDGLPDTDCEGRSYRIIADDYNLKDFAVEEQTGDVLTDAIYLRNSNVQDRFNVVITSEGYAYSDVSNRVRRTVASSDDAYDIVSHHVIEAGGLAKSHNFIDWNTVEYVDFSKPWWNESAHEELSVAGKSYLEIGAMDAYFRSAVYCVYYNKRLVEEYNIGDINAIVNNGEWTIDKQIELVTDSWNDINGDGKMDINDDYGFVTNSTSYSTPYIYSFGEKTVSRDSDGIPFLDMNQERFADIVTKVYKLYYDCNGSSVTSGWGDHLTIFSRGGATFLNCTFTLALNAGRDIEDDFSVIPYPKWNEEQESYLTMSDGSHSVDGIPVTVTDTAFIGLITEALNCESWKLVEPAQIDIALKVKGTRDEESVAMIDMILHSVVLDFGFVYAEYNGIGFVLSDLMGSKNSNFASYYAQNETSWNNKLQKTIDAFLE